MTAGRSRLLDGDTARLQEAAVSAAISVAISMARRHSGSASSGANLRKENFPRSIRFRCESLYVFVLFALAMLINASSWGTLETVDLGPGTWDAEATFARLSLVLLRLHHRKSPENSSSHPGSSVWGEPGWEEPG